MGTQHVIAVGLTKAPSDGRWAADARAADRTRDGHGGPRRTRPSAPPGDAA